MKIRTDFVTNSSSSSFVVEIIFELTNGKKLTFETEGATGETGPMEYFDGEILVTVSPKTLGLASNVEEMIKELANGVIDDVFDDWDENDEEIRIKRKIFEKSSKRENWDGTESDAYDFVKKIRKQAKSMDDIKSITIKGSETGNGDWFRTFKYDRMSSEYTGIIEGEEPFEREGESGGDLKFSTEGCSIKRKN